MPGSLHHNGRDFRLKTSDGQQFGEEISWLLPFADFVVGAAECSVLPAVPATKTERIAKCAARFVVRRRYASRAKRTQNPMREKPITVITSGPIAREKDWHACWRPLYRGDLFLSLLHKV